MSQDNLQAQREAFESVYPMPSQCMWTGRGYAATGYNAWDAHTHCSRWEGWLAARRASVSGLLKHETTPASSGAVSPGDVDELVAPAAVRADEVDAKVVNSGLDGAEGNLSAAADAHPHGDPQSEGAEFHDRTRLAGVQAASAEQGERQCTCGSGPAGGHTRGCQLFDEAMIRYDPFGLATQQDDREAGEPPLGGRWHFGNGVVVCGTLRVFGEDFDTDPAQEFKEQLLTWVCDTLNAAQKGQQVAADAAR